MMTWRTPAFWTDTGPASTCLLPAAWIYGLAGQLRQRLVKPMVPAGPVICVGNAVAGGAGKTPVSLSIAALLRQRGLHPAFLSRGYGGHRKGPVKVDTARHAAADVGDEALLLARQAPTIVAVDRRAGAAKAFAAGADVVVMDDGFQNPSLAKTLSLLVVDGTYGFGNGRLLPAGPLREPVAAALGRADAMVIVGEDKGNLHRRVPPQMPVLEARLEPAPGAGQFRYKRVIAFAGIGHPDKFFRTLETLNCEILERHAYPDHHNYDSDELMRLVEAADRAGAMLVTTAKDHVRLAEEARPMVSVLEITAAWNNARALETLIADRIGDG